MNYVPAVSLQKGFDTSAPLAVFAPRLFFKAAFALVIFAIFFTMAACGGSGNDTNGGNPTDTTPPEITSTSPADGAVDVATNAAVSVVFSEPMNESTITATGGFTLQNGGPVDGSIAYDPETQTAIFWPTGGFEDITSYTATLTTGVTDVAGNALASGYIWSFSTAENPIIRIPADGSSGRSLNPSVSEDGRYVAFEVDAPGYDGDNVFVHDAQTSVTTLINTATGGTTGSGWGYEPLVNSVGDRYVAFRSWATTLVTGDTNGFDDIFLRDTQTGTTTRVSLADDGAQSDNASRYPSISDNGQYVAFHSSATNLVAGGTSGSEIFMRDTVYNTTILVSINDSGVGGDSGSSNPSISGNGQSVAFESDAANLVAGDTNVVRDVFVRDTQAGTTTRVSVHTSGAQSDGWSYAASISADGRYVAFHSSAATLVDGDTNGADDIFVRDMQAGTTTRVSVHTNGTQGDGLSRFPSISGDGRYVAFQSLAANLVTGGSSGSEIFVRDTQAGTTILVSVNSSGVEGDGGSENPSISADGRYVVFQSDAANLVAGDTNGFTDVFRAPNPL